MVARNLTSPPLVARRGPELIVPSATPDFWATADRVLDRLTVVAIVLAGVWFLIEALGEVMTALDQTTLPAG